LVKKGRGDFTGHANVISNLPNFDGE